MARERLSIAGAEPGEPVPPFVPPESAPILSERDLAIRDFLNALRVAFKTAAMYSVDHPAFLHAVGGLLDRLGGLFETMSPLVLRFSPRSVFLDGRFWENEEAFAELGQHFHLRKIKGLTLHHGLTLAELTRLAAGIARPLPHFIKEGGALRMVQQERITHIELDLLDYSQLLHGEGEEIKDIWPYLLMEAVEEDDKTKLGLVAESFDKVVGKFNTSDLVQNEDLQKNFVKFFRYLRETSEDKHRSCARSLLKSVLKGARNSRESKFENLKLLVSDLSEADLASTLWEEIIGNDRFDSLSFSIFSKLVSKERHLKISTSLRDLFQTADPANRRADVERKLRALLKGTSGQMISEVYRETLQNLLSGLSFEKEIELDRRGLETSYRYLLLNLLAKAKIGGHAGPHLEGIAEEWERIVQDRDLDYLVCLQSVLRDRQGELAADPGHDRLCRMLQELVESWVLEGEASPGLDILVQGLGKSLLEPPAYLDALFRARVVTSTLLRAYLAFFPDGRAALRTRLEKSASASDLLEKIAWALRPIDTSLSLEVLKDIYAVGDTAVKVRTLLAMQALAERDEKFLFGALDARDLRIKAEALVLLIRHPRSRHVALTKLLGLQSPYGMRNRKLVRHIRMVENKGIRAAGEFLEALSQRRDFWNRRVRREALRVLEAWREG